MELWDLLRSYFCDYKIGPKKISDLIGYINQMDEDNKMLYILAHDFLVINEKKLLLKPSKNTIKLYAQKKKVKNLLVEFQYEKAD